MKEARQVYQGFKALRERQELKVRWYLAINSTKEHKFSKHSQGFDGATGPQGPVGMKGHQGKIIRHIK